MTRLLVDMKKGATGWLTPGRGLTGSLRIQSLFEQEGVEGTFLHVSLDTDEYVLEASWRRPTGPGVVVGQVMDISKDCALGDELITDPYFEDPTSLLFANISSGTVEITGGNLVATDIVSTYSYCIGLKWNGYTDPKLGQYKLYRLEWSYSNALNNQTGGEFRSLWSARYVPYRNGPFTESRFVHLGSAGNATDIGPYLNGGPHTFTWDYFSLKRVDGNPGCQGTTALRPTLRANADGKLYLEDDGADSLLSLVPVGTYYYAWVHHDKTVTFEEAGESVVDATPIEVLRDGMHAFVAINRPFTPGEKAGVTATLKGLLE